MEEKKFPCPVCGHYTLRRNPKRSHEVCPVCFWEDDPAHLDDQDYRASNNRISLREARINYIRYGVNRLRDLPCIRPPYDWERPENQKAPGKSFRRITGVIALGGLGILSLLIKNYWFFGVIVIVSALQGFRIWKKTR